MLYYLAYVQNEYFLLQLGLHYSYKKQWFDLRVIQYLPNVDLDTYRNSLPPIIVHNNLHPPAKCNFHHNEQECFVSTLRCSVVQ